MNGASLAKTHWGRRGERATSVPYLPARRTRTHRIMITHPIGQTVVLPQCGVSAMSPIRKRISAAPRMRTHRDMATPPVGQTFVLPQCGASVMSPTESASARLVARTHTAP